MQHALTFGSRLGRFIQEHKIASAGAVLFFTGAILMPVAASLNIQNDTATSLEVTGAGLFFSGLCLMILGRREARGDNVDDYHILPPSPDSTGGYFS